jgi:hypothetical protein
VAPALLRRRIYGESSISSVFLFILAVVPLLGLNLYTTIQARRELEREARQNAMRLAELISANQELHFEHTYQLLLTISLLLDSQVNNNIDCRKVILNLMAPQYANLGVLGPDRALACSSVPVSSAEVRPQPEFRHAIENEGPVIGGSQTIRGRPVLNVFYPMGKSSGKVPGFAFAALDLMWIKHLAASQLPAGSSFNLVDERGTFLVGSPTIEKMILSHEPVIQEILKNSKRVAFTTFQTDRSLHLVAFAPINGFTGQKLFVAIETVRQQPAFTSGLPSTFGSTALVILALLVIAAGWSAGDYFIVREIRSLLKTAQSLSVGELTARAPSPRQRRRVNRVSVLGQLSGGFFAALRSRSKDRIPKG